MVRLATWFFICLLFLCGPALARDVSFATWLDYFYAEALREGVSGSTLRKVLPKLKVDEKVIRLDRKQPEKSIRFSRYYKNVVTPWRIKEGRKLIRQHKAFFKDISAQGGPSPSVIVALWAVESGYGHNTGKYSVINSLATLAYEGRRASFFRRELIEAFKILDEEKMEHHSLKGSWAGAMGQCQFMPSTYRRYAFDGNGDGRRDIWEEEHDVLTSIANYLMAEGWNTGKPWGLEVKLKKQISKKQKGLDVIYSFKVWKRLGVLSLNGGKLPSRPSKASLIQPDGTGGRSFLVYDNFRTFMRWNRSTYFATSVGLLADALKKGK